MKADDCIELLRTKAVFWSKLGFAYDPPRLDEKGKPIVFFNDFDTYVARHKRFAEAGVVIHSSILFSGWVGVGRYDYELTDRILDAVFSSSPDIRYIPRIKLNVPLDWGKSNPAEMFVYDEGPRDAEGVRALVGTDKHDYLGYESPKGYYTAGGWQDDRPNLGGLISNQSFSSRKWLADAGEALRRLLDHLESSPYGKRILAYHIAYGISGETNLWGKFGFGYGGGRCGDYGIANRRHFFNWGLEKYGSLAALRAAWLQPELTEDNIKLPPPQQREGRTEDLVSFCRGNPADAICVDLDRFMTDVNVDAMEHFCKIAKERTGGKAAGVFYGYALGYRPAYTGHLGFERVLNSPYIDFIAAPKCYYRSEPGEPGGVIAPTQSINRKKLWLDELDNRTHLCVTAEKQCNTFEETRTVLWREFAKNLSHNSGFWWMDLGGGWFDSPDIMGEIGKIERISKSIRHQPHESVSEILVVFDEDSVYQCDSNLSAQMLFYPELLREIHLCGAPVDLFRLRDIDGLDLSRYKFVCLLNAFALSPEKWKKLKALLNKETSVCWNYAPGIASAGCELRNSRALTGFEVLERDKTARPKLVPVFGGVLENTAEMEIPAHESMQKGVEFPLLTIADAPGVKPLAVYADGGTALAEKGKDIYCALPLLKMEHWRRILEAAGCNFYAPANCTVYADNRFVAVFPRRDITGQLELKKRCALRELIAGEELPGCGFAPLEMAAKTAKFFQYGD
jgi:hypothetical protein